MPTGGPKGINSTDITLKAYLNFSIGSLEIVFFQNFVKFGNYCICQAHDSCQVTTILTVLLGNYRSTFSKFNRKLREHLLGSKKKEK